MGRVQPFSRFFSIAAVLLVVPLRGAAVAQVSVPGQYSTIQAAVNAVVSGALPDGTTISVQPGVYMEALRVQNTGRSFRLRGVAGPAATIVDAAGRGTSALHLYRATGQIVIEGLTFRNGVQGLEGGGFMIRESSPALSNCVFTGNSAFRGGGGALWRSNATFAGCVISNNRSSNFGGGLYIVDGSRPVFTACEITGNASGVGGAGVGNNGAGGGVFSHNSSPAFRGGRISGNASKFAAGGVFHFGEFTSPHGLAALVMEDLEIADNVASQYSAAENPAEGGGMHVEDNARATLTRVRVLRNRANTGAGLNAYRGRYDLVDSIVEGNTGSLSSAGTGFGGGIAATSNNPPGAPSGPGSVVALTRTLIRNNVAPMAGGIAIIGDNYSAVRASLSVAASVVSGNRSQSQGGGILLNRTNASLAGSLVIGNTVSGGQSPSGGGIMVIGGSSATIADTTFASNSAQQYGGGLYVDGSSTLQVDSSRFYANTAATRSGGGIFVGEGNPSGVVQNSIIADNAGYQIVEHLCPRSWLTYRNNTIASASGNDVYAGACGDAPTVQQLNAAPSGRASGNNANVPRFAHFLAAPAAGTRFTLAWSVARASSVSISGVGGVPAWGTLDVAPGATAAYTLTAATASGPIGPISVGVLVVPPPGPVSSVRRTDGDFDGDGKADVTVFRPSDGVWYSRFSTGGTKGVRWGATTDIPAAADYDGDGKADVALFRPSDGTWYLQYSSTGGAIGIAWGVSTDVPVPGDYDGDGKADLAVFRPNGVWYIRYATGATFGVAWGGGTDVAVPGDYDGDGKTDVAVFRPSNGVWYVRYTSNGATTGMAWGANGDIPVPADYDGDGKTDFAVFRPSDGVWYLRYSGNGAAVGIAWGAWGDVPAPGDYDGDGKADLAVFRHGTWYFRYASAATAGVIWGASGDVPALKP